MRASAPLARGAIFVWFNYLGVCALALLTFALKSCQVLCASSGQRYFKMLCVFPARRSSVTVLPGSVQRLAMRLPGPGFARTLPDPGPGPCCDAPRPRFFPARSRVLPGHFQASVRGLAGTFPGPEPAKFRHRPSLGLPGPRQSPVRTLDCPDDRGGAPNLF